MDRQPYSRLWMTTTAAAIIIMLLAVAIPADSATAYSGDGHTTDTLLTFKRTACYGPCPHYSIVVHEDGSLRYEGRAEVKVEGVVTDSLTTCQLQSLRTAFDDAGFFSFESSYTTGSICSEVMMDAPTVRTSFRDGQRSHRVVHYRGCRGFPNRDVLSALEDKIDRILNTQRWTGVER